MTELDFLEKAREVLILFYEKMGKSISMEEWKREFSFDFTRKKPLPISELSKEKRMLTDHILEELEEVCGISGCIISSEELLKEMNRWIATGYPEIEKRTIANMRVIKSIIEDWKENQFSLLEWAEMEYKLTAVLEFSFYNDTENKKIIPYKKEFLRGLLRDHFSFKIEKESESEEQISMFQGTREDLTLEEKTNLRHKKRQAFKRKTREVWKSLPLMEVEEVMEQIDKVFGSVERWPITEYEKKELTLVEKNIPKFLKNYRDFQNRRREFSPEEELPIVKMLIKKSSFEN